MVSKESIQMGWKLALQLDCSCRANRLPIISSIFSEYRVCGILLSLIIMEFAARDEFLILTYSLSCLQRIENSDQPLILKIVVTLHHLVGSSKRLIVVWLPSHTGLAGSMTIDAVAKVAPNLAESQTPVPFRGFYPLMSIHIASLWQRLWNAKTNSKRISSHP